MGGVFASRSTWQGPRRRAAPTSAGMKDPAPRPQRRCALVHRPAPHRGDVPRRLLRMRVLPMPPGPDEDQPPSPAAAAAIAPARAASSRARPTNGRVRSDVVGPVAIREYPASRPPRTGSMYRDRGSTGWPGPRPAESSSPDLRRLRREAAPCTRRSTYLAPAGRRIDRVAARSRDLYDGMSGVDLASWPLRSTDGGSLARAGRRSRRPWLSRLGRVPSSRTRRQSPVPTSTTRVGRGTAGTVCRARPGRRRRAGERRRPRNAPGGNAWPPSRCGRRRR